MSSNSDKRKKVLKKSFPVKPVLAAAAAIMIAGVLVIVNLPEKNRSETPSVNSLSSNLPVVTKKPDQKHTEVSASGSQVSIPLSELEGNTASYYVYKGFEKPVYFFAVRSSDGVIRAAFDACDVCYRSKRGYSQQGDLMICNNCGQRFPTAKINVEKGGCNPSPLDREVDNDSLNIKLAAVENGLFYF